MKYLFIATAFAFPILADCPEEAPCPLKKVERNSRLFGGPQAYYYHLKIGNSGTSAASATYNPYTGWLGGFILGYEYKKPDSLYAVLQTSYALGSIQRKSQGTGNNKRFIHDEILDARVGYNPSLTKDNSLFLTPYTGAGFRWNIQYRNPGVLKGLKFDYYKIYIPLGIKMNYLPTSWIDLGFDFEWMPDVLSMISISSLTGAYWELERMNNYLVELSCIFRFAKRCQVSLLPFWYHFWDGASIAVTDAGVALNLNQQLTNDWGGRIAFGVEF